MNCKIYPYFKGVTRQEKNNQAFLSNMLDAIKTHNFYRKLLLRKYTDKRETLGRECSSVVERVLSIAGFHAQQPLSKKRILKTRSSK
jgi:hypothetical protein